MTRKLNLTANVWREDNMLIAHCLELGVASQGYTVEDAFDNLRETVEPYLEPLNATVRPEPCQFGIKARAA
jgi:predicted RNase H-like HicB family nuclease